MEDHEAAARERDHEGRDVERADAAARRDEPSTTEIEESEPGQNSEELPQ